MDEESKRERVRRVGERNGGKERGRDGKGKARGTDTTQKCTENKVGLKCVREEWFWDDLLCLVFRW
eukprot:1328334-Amorphochlora_amoeboformis.AAC.1